MGRQQTYRKSRSAHDADGGDECLSASIAITKGTKERGSQRAHHHTHAKSSQAIEQPRYGVIRRKEQRGEMDGQGCKSQEVVPLDESAKTGRQGYLAVGSGIEIQG